MRKEREPAAWLLCFRLSSFSWEKGARVHGNIPAAAEPRRPNETASDTHASTHGTAHTLASEQEQGPFCSYLHCGVKKAPLFLNQIVPLRYFIYQYQLDLSRSRQMSNYDENEACMQLIPEQTITKQNVHGLLILCPQAIHIQL